MVVNILDAIKNLVLSKQNILQEVNTSSNRANAMGDTLEKYVQDIFANSVNCSNENEREEKINDVLSYTGNSTNPPDALIRNGAAIETKKIQSRTSQLQLNSSFPGAKLYYDNPRLKKEVRDFKKLRENEWTERDIIYAVGYISKKNKKNYLKELALIDAEAYCANKSVYLNLFNKIKAGINNIPNTVFSDTKELGRINQIDPLKRSDLRVRGMWLLKNPFETFADIYPKPNKDTAFSLVSIITKHKFDSFPNHNEFFNFANSINGLEIKDVEVQDPNDATKKISCKLITYSY